MTTTKQVMMISRIVTRITTQMLDEDRDRGLVGGWRGLWGCVSWFFFFGGGATAEMNKTQK